MAPLGIGDWSFNTLLMCFAGGILGTTLGGLYAFIICGLLVLLGCISVLGGGSDFLLLNVGLGPIFGPHVGGFASGVAGVSYAIEIKKNLANPALSLGSKDILSPLIDTSWDVYLVGGVEHLGQLARRGEQRPGTRPRSARRAHLSTASPASRAPASSRPAPGPGTCARPCRPRR